MFSKKKVIFILVLSCLCLFGRVHAQEQVVVLDSATSGTTIQSPATGMSIYDNGGSAANYSRGCDYHITVEGLCQPDSHETDRYLCFELVESELDIYRRDTLYIYDGPSIQSPLLLKVNNSYRSAPNLRFFVSARNISGKLTLRFRSTSRSLTGRGFCVRVSCGRPCEHIVPVIDSVFDRYDLQTNAVVGHGTIRDVPDLIDTVFYYRGGVRTDSILRIDTLSWRKAALLCMGQGAIFHGHGEYTHATGYYHPSDTTSQFCWQFGADDSLSGIAATQAPYGGFQSPRCSWVSLSITDANGCPSSVAADILVRVAQNPVRTLYDLGVICSDDSLEVSVGYVGGHGTLILKRTTYGQMVSKVNTQRSFIPDGPMATQVGMPPCYETSVTFTEFPNRTITSASDICSVCLNFEHSFMGDYSIALRCPLFDEEISPTAYQAVLKYSEDWWHYTSLHNAQSDWTAFDGVGISINTGWPLGGGRTIPGDGLYPYDSLQNPFGVGLDYCWSRNGRYTLVTGDPADLPTPSQHGNWYLSSPGNTVTTADTAYFHGYTPIPDYFHHGGEIPTGSNVTRKPSNHADRTDYYSPDSDFSELIGCPINGDWKLVFCDYWGADNGWIFNWSLDICGDVDREGEECQYRVDFDSVVWLPDTNYATDFADGQYRGLRINPHDPATAYVSSPDTAGDFRVQVTIYDEFGCVWDTSTHITTVRSPRPDLGPDTLLCSVNTLTLDAADGLPDSQHYTYLWEPYGETTDVITTHTATGNEVRYIVEVTNRAHDIACATRDTIRIAVSEQPVLGFDIGQYAFEGCEPMTIRFNNTTQHGYKYRWMFGDGSVSTQQAPVHTYLAGAYDLRYYVESERGCRDSLVIDNFLTVFPTPVAAFTWDPVYPTVAHPSIQLKNRTAPDNGANKYFWEVQYDRDNPYSVHTLVVSDPAYEWTAGSSGDLSGSYIVRLIARTDNTGPSGRMVQCADTVENTVMLINDFLQFPSVVTANGDGINDRFVVKNLVEGLAFPVNLLEIFDRWGKCVYSAENITKDDEFWDPAATRSPAGIYFYRFSAQGYNGNVKRNGAIEVIR